MGLAVFKKVRLKDFIIDLFNKVEVSLGCIKKRYPLKLRCILGVVGLFIYNFTLYGVVISLVF